MKEFKVLPTDERFQDLTEEQLLLMFEHWKLDNPKVNKKTGDDTQAHDEDYQEPEEYHDPHFDDEWNAVDEEEEDDFSDSDNVGEECLQEVLREIQQQNGQGNQDDIEEPIDIDGEDWEEV